MGRAFQNHGYNYRLLLFSPLSSLFSPLSPFHSVTRLHALVFLLPSDYLFNFLVFSCLLYALSVFLYFFLLAYLFLITILFLVSFLLIFVGCFLGLFLFGFLPAYQFVSLLLLLLLLLVSCIYIFLFFIYLSFIYFCCGKISCFLIFFPFVC